MSLIERAAGFAAHWHAGQTRKSRAAVPYIVHPAEVAALASLFGGDAQTVAAAWLHDTVEDCPPTSLADIAADFGPEVAAIVAEVSDDKSLPKAERKRRQIVHAPDSSPRATLVKICDKISNVRSLAQHPPVGWDRKRQLAYLDWAEAVVAALPEGYGPPRLAFARQVAACRAIIGHEDQAD